MMHCDIEVCDAVEFDVLICRYFMIELRYRGGQYIMPMVFGSNLAMVRHVRRAVALGHQWKSVTRVRVKESNGPI